MMRRVARDDGAILRRERVAGIDELRISAQPLERFKADPDTYKSFARMSGVSGT